MVSDNIFPYRDKFIDRKKKENKLNQKGIVIWLTGLSGSGKSTLAKELEKQLVKDGYLTQVLDGDKIRNGLNSDLGFTNKDRIENIRRIAEVSKLFCNAGIVTISAFISPTEEVRQIAKKIIGPEDYFEVYVEASLSICEQRDKKGLYQKARMGTIKNFTGISSLYETPEKPNLTINTEQETIVCCVKKIYGQIIISLS